MISPNEETMLPPSHSKLQIYLQIKGGFKQRYQNYNYNNHSQTTTYEKIDLKSKCPLSLQ